MEVSILFFFFVFFLIGIINSIALLSFYYEYTSVYRLTVGSICWIILKI